VRISRWPPVDTLGPSSTAMELESRSSGSLDSAETEVLAARGRRRDHR
jgi:hypothetical protein